MVGPKAVRAGAAEGGTAGTDLEWAPFQMLCLILGPLLFEPVMPPNLDQPMFDPEMLARRGAANQRLLRHGLFGHVGGEKYRPSR